MLTQIFSMVLTRQSCPTNTHTLALKYIQKKQQEYFSITMAIMQFHSESSGWCATNPPPHSNPLPVQQVCMHTHRQTHTHSYTLLKFE